MNSILGSDLTTVLVMIEKGAYWTNHGFAEMNCIERAFRWLLSLIGLVDSTVQKCAQRTFEQISIAFDSSKEAGDLRHRSALIASLFNAKDLKGTLSSLEGSVPRAHACFVTFLTEKLGFDKKTLRPPHEEASQLSLHIPISEVHSPPALVEVSEESAVVSPLADDPFDKLPVVTDLEKETISWLIETMAAKNSIELGRTERNMREKGEKVSHIHPFRFLEYILKEGEMASEMWKIEKNFFKWNGFMSDFGKRLDGRANRHDLKRYLPGFARSLGVSEETVRKNVRRRKWRKLVRFLIKAKRGTA